MDQDQAARALEQERQRLLRLVAALDQQRAATSADRDTVADWQQRLQVSLAYWSTRGAVLGQVAWLEAPPTAPPDLTAFPPLLAAIRADVVRTQEDIQALLPTLFKAEAAINTALAHIDQVQAGWEQLQRQVLDLYEQTKGR